MKNELQKRDLRGLDEIVTMGEVHCWCCKWPGDLSNAPEEIIRGILWLCKVIVSHLNI